VAGDDGRPGGVETETPNHRSTVARLARVPGRVRPNNRFAYFAYRRGVRPATDWAHLWLLDPDGAAQFPNEDDRP
jgi:hypothetical protein